MSPLIHRTLAALALGLTASLARAADSSSSPVQTDDRLHFGSVTVYSENDKYFAGTDEHYTNGLKLSVLSTDLRSFTDDSVPAPVRWISRGLGGLVSPDQPYKLGLSVGQNIYTPVNTALTTPIPTDRPYAAWLYLGIAFQIYHPPADEGGIARLDVFEVTAGVVGPSALGRQAQNGFHDVIGADHAQGWSHQIHDEPGLNLVYERQYRLSTAHARDAWGADLIPHAGFSLGNVFTYANTGAEVRAGYRLPADFGSNLIRPSGDSNAAVRPPFSLFLFAAVDGRAVARDITLDGNTFQDSPSVDKRPLVADLYTGIGMGTRHWQLTYAQAYRTKEFYGQTDRSVFGSLSVSFFY
ncbi:MAG: lipid A deacylase LpxR family protein [Opitutaceae bacterium]|jgi:hypothetical protein